MKDLAVYQRDVYAGRPTVTSRGQGMVEFALILPVLLVFLIGIMEFGRLLTIYNSVSNSSREAVRWGVVVGVAPSGVPYWKDCAGMKAAAARTAGLATLDSVTITYEKPDPAAPTKFTQIGACDGSDNAVFDPLETDLNNPMQNGYRVKIAVQASYAPIVPLIPIPARTFTFTSSRTVFTSIQGAPACNDDIDNDNDGKTDYNPVPGLGDPDCSSSADDSEQHITPTNCYSLEVRIFNDLLSIPPSTATDSNVLVTPASSGGCDPGFYSYDSTVTITAINSGGNILDTGEGSLGFQDATPIGGNKATVLILSDQDAGVFFTHANCYTLYSGVASGSGSVPAPDPAPDCVGDYTQGTQVQLTANPNAGFMLDCWENAAGACIDTVNPVTVTMDTAKTYKARFIADTACFNFSADVSPNGTGSIQVNPADNAPCNGNKRKGSVTLTALPEPFYVFKGWTGDYPTSANPLIVAMTGSRSVIANFTRCYQLLYFANNGSVSAYPESTGGCAIYSYESGTQVTLRPTGNPGFTFNGWIGDHTGNEDPLTLTMNSDTTVTANFVVSNGCYTFTRVASPTAGGTFPATSPTSNCITSGGQPGYQVNTDVQFSTVTNYGYTFINWTLSGGGIVTSTSTTVKITQDTSATANFIPNCYTLSTPPAANGTVTQTLVEGSACTNGVGQPGYTYWSKVRLTPNPAPGYVLAAWSGDGSGNANPYDVTINKDLTINATFETGCFDLTWAVGSGSGSITPPPAGSCVSGRYQAGTYITLSATGSGGDDFINWTDQGGSVISTDSTYQFQITGDTTLFANFGRCYTIQTSANPETAGGQPTNNAIQVSTAKNCADGGKYTAGTVVNLTASPGPGYQFTGWSGVDTIAGNQATVTMNANRFPAANFSATCFTLSLLVTPGTASSPPVSPNSGSIGVTVQSAPNGTCGAANQYTYNTQLQLTATPNAGYSFGSWTGAVSGTNNPVALSITGNSTVTARFNRSCVIIVSGPTQLSSTTLGVDYGNYTGSSKNITKIQVSWSPTTNQKHLDKIEFGTAALGWSTIWTGTPHQWHSGDSATSFSGNTGLLDAVTKTLRMTFDFTVAGHSFTVTTWFNGVPACSP